MSDFLYVAGGLRGGGSERQLLYLVRGLRKRDIEVTVAVWNFCDDDIYVGPLREAGAAVIAVEGRWRWAKARSLRRLIRASGARVVHSYPFYLNAVVAAAAAGTQAVAVGSVRSTLALARGDSGRLIGSVSARWPQRQVYNNAFAAGEAGRRRWWRPERIAVVPNSIDLDAFAEVEVPRGGSIAAIGSLLPVKRWDRLIALAERLRERGVEFQIKIAGDGPLRASLQSDIDRLRLQPHVTLPGYVTGVKQFLADSALLVHTSDSEGSPNAVMEALAAGRPVVATAVGDVPRLVRDGETGFVVPPADADMLFDRVSLLLRDYERCAAMGRRAREVARERFGAASLAAQTLDAYRKLGAIPDEC